MSFDKNVTKPIAIDKKKKRKKNQDNEQNVQKQGRNKVWGNMGRNYFTKTNRKS